MAARAAESQIMTSQVNDRNFDDEPTVKIRALGTSFELHDPTRTELSSDVLGALRILTPTAPCEARSPPRGVAALVRIAGIHPRPTQTEGAVFLLVATLSIVASALGRLAAVGRGHAILVAKTLAPLTVAWGAQVRRKAAAVLALFRPWRALWSARASAAWRPVRLLPYGPACDTFAAARHRHSPPSSDKAAGCWGTPPHLAAFRDTRSINAS